MRTDAERLANIKRALAEREITLFWHPSGPVMRYASGFLHIEDLNPEVMTKWRMNRGEMFRLGWRCIWAALTAREE